MRSKIILYSLFPSETHEVTLTFFPIVVVHEHLFELAVQFFPISLLQSTNHRVQRIFHEHFPCLFEILLDLYVQKIKLWNCRNQLSLKNDVSLVVVLN